MMKSLTFSIIIISSLQFVTVFSNNINRHHSNETTNQLGGIQEELQLLKVTVHTLVALVDIVHNKVDVNTNTMKNLISKVTSYSTKVDSLTSKVDSLSTEVSSLSLVVDLNSKKVDSTTKKLDSTVKKVVSNVNNTVANSKNIATLSEDISPSTEQCRSLPSNICDSCKCRDDRRLSKKYYCDCTHLPAKRDCKQFHQEGFRIDGVYRIHQNNIRIIRIFCDQSTDGGGWSVFQRRLDGSVNFYRDWLSYKIGFGDLQHEFWIGNTNLFTLSLQGIYPSGNELSIELTDWNGSQKVAKYGSFEISNEDRMFQLNVRNYFGTAGDSFSQHNGMKFSTFDQDHDAARDANCAVDCVGAWWYDHCHTSNLNGFYYDFRYWKHAKGVCWLSFQGYSYSMKRVEMKLRRKG